MDAPIPQLIRCRHRRANGRSCLTAIAMAYGPLIVGKAGGREYGDPAWIRCDRCRHVTHFRGGEVGELPVTPGAGRDGRPPTSDVG